MIGLAAPLLVCLALAWVALIVAAPMLPGAPAGILYALGSRICHQIAERSFHVGAAQLPVCARCLGIYAGFAAGLVFAYSATLSRRVDEGAPAAARCRGLTPRMIVGLGALPTAITVVLEWAGLWAASNLARAVAGVPLGVGVALAVIGGLHYDECTPRPPIARDQPPSRI